MGLLDIFLGKPPKDYVMLRLIDGWVKREVDWIWGKPYAYAHGGTELNLLLRGGKISGKSYVTEWTPASHLMVDYFAVPPTEEEVKAAWAEIKGTQTSGIQANYVEPS